MLSEPFDKKVQLPIKDLFYLFFSRLKFFLRAEIINLLQKVKVLPPFP